MIRQQLVDKNVQREPDFRWRGGTVSRLEGFSDAVFGFALTLLVVSLEVPKDFKELLVAMRGFVAFGICFFVLFQAWRRHYLFFRRYGLEDSFTVALNGVLLFLILLYVYPLKFVFTLFIDGVLGFNRHPGAPSPITMQDVPLLFVIYGLGFASVAGIFALFHWHAWRQREALELNAWERHSTRLEIQRDLMMAGLGLLSVAIAGTLGNRVAGLAGWVYCLIGVVEFIHGAREGEARRRYASAPQE